MFIIFSVFSLFSLVTFSSQSIFRVLNDGSDQNQKNDSADTSLQNADHAVIKHLHKIYRSDLEKKDIDVKQLLILKQQYIVRNHIEEFETDFSLNFVPEWTLVDKWSSPARQSIEIRRQRWEYIFRNHSDLYQVQNLASELVKSGVNQSTFCREIAEAYFILSHNSYIYNKGPMPNSKDHKITEFVNHPLMDQSLKIFMHVFPDSHIKLNGTEELVQIPKSMYQKLLRKDAHVNLLKKHHESEMNRQKNKYENKIKRVEEYRNSDSDSDYNSDSGSS